MSTEVRDALVTQRDQLIMQRSVAKDQVENAERSLQQIVFAIQAIDEQASIDEKKEESETAEVAQPSEN